MFAALKCWQADGVGGMIAVVPAALDVTRRKIFPAWGNFLAGYGIPDPAEICYSRSDDARFDPNLADLGIRPASNVRRGMIDAA
jgi:hypothetical protein